jgi:hypothetical protein
MYVKQQNERQKILLSGQFQSPKAQHHRKTKNTTVGTGLSMILFFWTLEPVTTVVFFVFL